MRGTSERAANQPPKATAENRKRQIHTGEKQKNYTQNYQLPQWEKDDRIMMEDFNESYQKLESALNGARNAIPQLNFGSYTGNGAYPRDINLGYQPKAVLLMRSAGTTWTSSGCYGGLIAPGFPLGNSIVQDAEVTGSGFRLLGSYTNQANTTYYYLAIR